MDHLERQLAEEELNSGEIRELLDRLAQEELGGSDMSTLSDVAEVTGTPVNVLARMLAEIRHVPEVKQKLETHERRLDEHDRIIRSERRPKARSTYTDFQRFRELEEQDKLEKNLTVAGVFILLFIFVMIVMGVSGSLDTSPKSHVEEPIVLPSN